MDGNGEKLDLVIFKIREDDFGIEVRSTREVLKVEEISAVPRAPDFIEGIINVRGHAVAVIDLRKRFGIQKPGMTEKTRVIIVRSRNMTVGLIVDAIVGVSSFARALIQATPRVLSAQVDDRFVSGVTRLNGRMVILLNLEELLGGKDKAGLKTRQESKSESPEKNPTLSVESGRQGHGE